MGGLHQSAVNHDTQLSVTGDHQSTTDVTERSEEPTEVEWCDLPEEVKVRHAIDVKHVL